MELQRRIDDFRAAGVRIFAVDPEPVEQHAAFAQEAGLTFPFLSDAGSEVIRRYGILNTLIDPDERLYGLPFPGSYLTDTEGRVTAKFFRRRYQERDAPEIVLMDGLELPLDTSSHPAATDGGDVTATLATPQLRFQQNTSLLVRLRLDEGLHVYGQPVPEGYIPTTVTVQPVENLKIGEPRYPRTRPFRVEGVDAEFHIFEGDVQIEVPLLSFEREAESMRLDIEVTYQACNDRECFLPRTVRLTIDAPVGDLNRPPPRE